MDTHTHIHTHTQDNYSNPRCACAPRVNNDIIGAHAHVWPRNHDVGRSKFVMATFLSLAVRDAPFDPMFAFGGGAATSSCNVVGEGKKRGEEQESDCG